MQKVQFEVFLAIFPLSVRTRICNNEVLATERLPINTLVYSRIEETLINKNKNYKLTGFTTEKSDTCY